MKALELVTVNKIKFWQAYKDYEAVCNFVCKKNNKAVVHKDQDYVAFDKVLGLEYEEGENCLSEDDYVLRIKDVEKFLLAKIKYGF